MLLCFFLLGEKQKWSKGKVRDKKNHAVVFDQPLYDKLMKEATKKLKVITIYGLVEQYKINCSLARKAVAELLKKGLVKPIVHESGMIIYTKSDKEPEVKEVAKKDSKEDAKAAAKAAAKERSNAKAEERAIKAAGGK